MTISMFRQTWQALTSEISEVLMAVQQLASSSPTLDEANARLESVCQKVLCEGMVHSLHVYVRACG